MSREDCDAIAGAFRAAADAVFLETVERERAGQLGVPYTDVGLLMENAARAYLLVHAELPKRE